ncbi:uncharacterized protein F4807DRAFT_472991 [Annulohypoxylon truncatum]|uniref:uncharacterized protein n=1 Tax=Annulohypoxylon truncatum TaxID=327061 RepID=UPI00200742C4|nr:uncharacterized protein F4807DRAFT_472991 [Annulohypoxylon truncatum]KAI1211535.1 hypothetical protein F4807DRAFT_472991 [Annulohypoxylon truncatum]
MEDSSVIHELRMNRRQLSLSNSQVVESSPATIPPSEEVGEPLRPSTLVTNLLYSIDSLLSFVHYISKFPRPILGSLANEDSGVKAFAGNQMTRSLGSGASFHVVSAYVDQYPDELREGSSPQGKLRAIKIPAFKPSREESLDQRELRMLREIAWELRVLCHEPLGAAPNVAGYFGLVWKLSNDPDLDTRLLPCIVMEYAELGTLNDLFQGELFALTFVTKWKLTNDIGNGMATLHRHGIVHSDLKAENVLVFPDHKGGLIAKVADFGFAMNSLERGDSIFFRGFTPPWDAPEISNGRVSMDILGRADLYSYGLLIWRLMLEGRSPFDRPDCAKDHVAFQELADEKHSERLPKIAQMKREVGDGFLMRVTATLPGKGLQIAPLESLFKGTLRLNPQDRVRSFEDLLNMPAEEQRLYSGISTSEIEASLFESLPGLYIGQATLTQDSVLDLHRLKEVLPSKVLHQIFTDLSTQSQVNPEKTLLDLSLCYFLGIGTFRDHQKGISTLLDSARAGDKRAMAIAWRINSVVQPDVDSDHPWDEWLFEGTCNGSTIAAEDLESRNRPLFEVGMRISKEKSRYGVSLAHMDKAEATRLTSMANSQQQVDKWMMDNPGSTINYLHQLGWTLLHFAAVSNNAPMIKYLIDNGAEVNRLNFRNETPLLCACRCGNLDATRILVLIGASVTRCNDYGTAPLHYLISFHPADVADVVQILMEAGADLHAISLPACLRYPPLQFLGEEIFCSGTPLHWATSVRRTDIVKHLLGLGADPRGDDRLSESHIAKEVLRYDGRESAFHLAAHRADSKTLTVLLNDNIPGYSIRDTGLPHPNYITVLAQSDFERMCEYGPSYRDEVMKTISLLDPKLHVSQLLTAATSSGSESMVEYLLERGADVNQSDSKFGIYPLQLASLGHNTQSMILFLLKSGADPTNHYPDKNASCLTSLALGSPGPLTGTLVEEMVQRGCSYSRYAESFKMLFIRILRNGDFHLAGTLLSSPGAKKEKMLEGVLGDFIEENSRHILPAVHFLLHREPLYPVLFESERGSTIFHKLAAIKETLRDDKLNHQLARQIISVYRNPDYLNSRDTKGRTALVVAVQTGNHLLLKELLTAGGDSAAKSPDVTLQLIDRISTLGNIPLLGIDFYTTITRYKTFNLLVENTVHLVLTWLNYLEKEQAVSPDTTNGVEYRHVKRLLKVWEQAEVVESKFKKSLFQAISREVTVKITNRTLINEGCGKGDRPLTNEEKKNSALLLWEEFLSDLRQLIQQN